MKKLVFLLLSGIFLSCCSRTNMKPEKDSFFILVNLWSNDRSGKDYIKLWINDSLLFKGPYLTNYIEGNEETIDDVWGMEVANLSKKDNEDSIRIAIRLIALDDQLFSGKRVIDTTFKYRIDNIPGIAISYPRDIGYFNVIDTINFPQYWYYY
ncbi:hypothetical protein [uncultured Bacteroides sp.]|uniref:hypothetical protein n=1 Tax=uncultured Bacteroides sp. TaxID=162156 RepID=UPI002AA8BF86|nr:hypothetical protein [uncultured Bacteroides sp.]